MPTNLKAAWMLPVPKQMGALLDAVIVLPNITWPIPSLAADGTQIPRADVKTMIDAWVAAFTAAKCGLFTGNPVISADTVLADLSQPVGTWYALKVCVFGAVHDGGGNFLYIGTASLQWDYSGVSPAETITGAMIVDVVP